MCDLSSTMALIELFLYVVAPAQRPGIVNTTSGRFISSDENSEKAISMLAYVQRVSPVSGLFFSFGTSFFSHSANTHARVRIHTERERESLIIPQ